MEIEKKPESGGLNNTTMLMNGKGDAKQVNCFDNKIFKVFCEKHRPLKIVKEMEERDQQTIEEI